MTHVFELMIYVDTLFLTNYYNSYYIHLYSFFPRNMKLKPMDIYIYIDNVPGKPYGHFVLTICF